MLKLSFIVFQIERVYALQNVDFSQHNMSVVPSTFTVAIPFTDLVKFSKSVMLQFHNVWMDDSHACSEPLFSIIFLGIGITEDYFARS